MARNIKYNFDDLPDALYEKGLFSRENPYYFMITEEQVGPIIWIISVASVTIVLAVYVYG